MRRATLPFTILLLLTAACGEPQDAHARELKKSLTDAATNLGQAADALLAYAYDKRDELQRDLQPRLAEAEQQLATLRTRAAELTGDAKARAQQTATELEQQLATARARLTGIGDASEAAWAETRKGVVEAWQVLQQSLAKAKDEFK